MKPAYINGIRGMCDNASLHVTEQIEGKSSPCARCCSWRFQLYGYGMVQPEGDTRYAAAKQGSELSWS